MADGDLPRLGPFALESRVTGHAMSEVWRGLHRASRRPVAIKFVRPPAGQEATFKARFAHEVRAAAGLDHPLVVRLLDHGEVTAAESESTWIAEGTPYLVMEWLDGPALSAEPPTDWTIARAVLDRLLDALAHAHARGVVHRDVKPGNIMRVDRGPVLTDFGIALLDAPADTRSDEESLIGTPPYMAPEQVRGDWRAVGPWTDLYAVGCTAFELVCGTRAFDGPSLLAVLERHLSGQRAPYAPRFDTPPGVEDWLTRLLEPDPARRFRFAADAALALRALDTPRPSISGWTPLVTLPRPEEGAWRAGPGPDGRPPLPRAPGETGTGPLFPLPDVGGGLMGLRRVHTVGRTAERDWLWTALARAIRHEALQVVTLESAAGMGKTHLAQWLVYRGHELGLAQGLRAHHERGSEHGSGLGAMFCRHLRCIGADRDTRMAQLSATFAPPLARGLAAALDPAGRHDEPDEPVVFGSAEERYAVFAEVLDVLAAQRPLVVHLDDLQWGEDALRFALYLLRRRPGLPAVLLLSARPDAMAPRTAISALWDRLRSQTGVSPIRLGPLSPADQARQIASLVQLDSRLAERLHEATAGSPLLAEETVRLWLSNGSLTSTPEGAVLRPGMTAAAPEHADIWMSRVDSALARAESRAGEAFELAATLGVEVHDEEWAAACALAGLPVPQVGSTRMHADRLVKTRPDGRWCFVHRALREALVGRARTGGRWRAWNRYAADTLARRPDVDPERLAAHQLEARQPRLAAETLLRAFDEATVRTDQAAARRALVMRARALGELEVPTDGPEWVRTRILRARMARRFGQMDVARRWSVRAETQARRLDDAGLHTEALVEAGIALRVTESDATGWPLLEQAVQRAEETGEPRLLARARFAAAACLNLLGRIEQAENLLHAGLEAAEDAGDSRTEADCLVGLADIARRRGDLETSKRTIDAAYERYRRAGHRIGRAMVSSIRGDLARYGGDLDAAEHHYEDSRQLYAAADAVDLPIAETNLALVLYARGSIEAARGRLEDAQHQAWAGHELRVLIHALLLPVVARLGDWEAWARHMAATAPLRDGRLAEPDAASAARDAAERALDAGRADEALAALTLAAAQLRTLGRQAEVAEVRARLAEVRAVRDGQTDADRGAPDG